VELRERVRGTCGKPAKRGLPPMGHQSPGSSFRGFRSQIADSLRRIFEKLPFFGDGGRRLGSTYTACRAHSIWSTDKVLSICLSVTFRARSDRKDDTRFRGSDSDAGMQLRRDPTGSAVATPANKAPARRAVITTPRTRRALRASVSGERHSLGCFPVEGTATQLPEYDATRGALSLIPG
jgi:hypothetical protein